MDRYSRQIILIGNENQQKLNRATVAVVGLGGIGSVAAEMLARAGINIILVDRDVVEKNNLQRQNYSEDDVGRPKAEALAKRLGNINSDISIKAFFDDFNPFTADMLNGADLVIDGLDNLESRFILNDYCLKNKLPLAYCSAIRDEGFFAFFDGRACLRCIFDKKHTAETCETDGVLPTITNFIASVAANEVIKYIITGNAAEEMIHVNTTKPFFNLMKYKKRKGCRACQGIYEFLNNEKSSYVSMVCDNSYHIASKKKLSINSDELGTKLGKNPSFRDIVTNDVFLGVTYGNNKIILFNDGRMIIRNVSSEKEAKSIAAKIIGF
jgi:adenylyltransferase/sulfurtransferase